MTMKTMIGNEEIMIISIRIPFILVYLVLHSNSLEKLPYKTVCQAVTIFVYLPD